MDKENVLITGANGEVGHVLLTELAKRKKYKIIAFYRSKLDESLLPYINKTIQGDILDEGLLEKVFQENKIDIIFHLAAILSSAGEDEPELAHEINVEGTIHLLEIATKESLRRKKSIKFIFPSSIAVYGITNPLTKRKADRVSEEKFNNPITMYGCNKLYCEKLGEYFSKYYKLVSDIKRNYLIDFRCVRFPGLISANTLPTGGTSDFASEMVHAAAQKKEYKCFVKEDTRIPFLAMPDGVTALIKFCETPRSQLTRTVYNLTGFSPLAKEIEEEIKKTFPEAKIRYQCNQKRQKIVDSWPEDLDDGRAKKDWGWSPIYDFKKAFEDYLIPAVIKRYRVS
jgi:nucleoside-diphosphate-sugar epimerase